MTTYSQRAPFYNAISTAKDYHVATLPPRFEDLACGETGGISAPRVFAVLRDTAHPAPGFLRQPLSVRGDRRARVPHSRLRGFLRADAALSCPEWERSTASAPEARRVRSEQVSLSSAARTCRSSPPTPDSPSGSQG